MAYKNSTIYYGDGNCSLQGCEAFCVMLRYTGDAIVETQVDHLGWIVQRKDKILVLSNSTPLTDLFVYSGTLNILSAEVTDGEELITPTLKRIDNYSERIGTKAEDLTINSEELVTRKSSGAGQPPRQIKHPIIENQNTETHDGKLYLENGNRYHGDFHVHTKDGSAMTGSVHSPISGLLYIKPTIRGRFIDRLVPTTIKDAWKIIKLEKNKMRSDKSVRKFLRSKSIANVKKDK